MVIILRSVLLLNYYLLLIITNYLLYNFFCKLVVSNSNSIIILSHIYYLYKIFCVQRLSYNFIILMHDLMTWQCIKFSSLYFYFLNITTITFNLTTTDCNDCIWCLFLVLTFETTKTNIFGDITVSWHNTAALRLWKWHLNRLYSKPSAVIF